MIKKAIILLIILIILIGTAAAGNNTTDQSPIEKNEKYSNEIVQAEENGHLNTNFSDGSKGYCLEYGEHEAQKGDKFYVVNTTYAINNNDNKSIADHLKVLFIDYYNFTQTMPPVYTQHIIWYFSDNFYHPISIGQNMEMIDSIIATTHKYPDLGFKIINNTTSMFFNFKVLISEFENHQNYFAYKIWFNDTPKNESNITVQGNNSTIFPPMTQNNESILENYSIIDIEKEKIEKTVTSNNVNIFGLDKKTGVGIWGVFCIILLLLGILLLDKR